MYSYGNDTHQTTTLSQKFISTTPKRNSVPVCAVSRAYFCASVSEGVVVNFFGLMGSPQLENGFVRIANEIFEAWARINLPGEAEQILKVIIRKTYGFNKKSDSISYSQFVAATGLKRRSVRRAVSQLVKMNIITRRLTAPTATATFCFVKSYKDWKLGANKRLGAIRVVRWARKSAPQKTLTKDNIYSIGVQSNKPTREQALNHFKSKGCPVEADRFFDYYESNGWRVGKNPMKNWTAAAANWLRQKNRYEPKNTSPVFETPTREKSNWQRHTAPPPKEFTEMIRNLTKKKEQK